MKKIFLYMVFAVYAGLNFSTTDAQAATLTLLTNEEPPRNFTKDGKIVGASSEQVEELMKRAGIDYKIEMVAWTRAVTLAETDPDTCAFSGLHTEARDPKFKWVEPLLIDPIVLSKKKGSSFSFTNLDAAKQTTIGTQANSASLEVAVKHGFTTIETTLTYDLLGKKLEADRVQFGVSPRSSLKGISAEGVQVEEVAVIEEKLVSMLCNKGIPDEIIKKLNATLAEMIKDGTQAKINSAYGL